MKKTLLLLFALSAFVACDKPETKPLPEPPVDQTNIALSIDNERLTAYQVIYSVYPHDKEALYYCDVMSKARWESTDIATLKTEIDDSIMSFADMTGATYQEVLEQMMLKGDTVDFVSNSGYRGETDFVLFAFYWNGKDEDVFTAEFTTPAPVASSEDVAIEVDSVEPYAMTVSCTPTEGITEYYYYFDETAKVEAILEELEDENAFLSYQAMNLGMKYTEARSFNQMGLKPETSYTAILMAIDESGNRLQRSVEQTTSAVEQNERVESELFERLLGKYTATQTVFDGYNEPTVSEFTVTIVASVEDYDYDYRANNQLVALVDGWNNIAYYGIEGLIAEGIENPEEKFGPKWILDIAEGDVVTIDGQAHNSVIGWMFMGNCFMASAVATGSTPVIKLDTVLNVNVSDNYSTITISSPNAGYFPSLVYDFTGFGWMGYFFGMSDITLTRTFDVAESN